MLKNLFLYSMTLMVPQLASAAGSTTVYNISGDRTRVTTEVKNAGNTFDKQMASYMSDRLLKALKEMPGVTNVQMTKGQETVEKSTYYSHETKTRKSSLFLTMNLPAKVSFLLNLEESYNECIKEKANQDTTYGGGEDGGSAATSNCTLNSKAKITGPFSVYGSYANNSLVGFSDDDLKDMQDLSFELSKSYNGKDVSLETRFNVNSMMFERSIARFLKAFNVQGVDMSVVGMSRQNILLGSSRLIRLVNEKMIEDKGGGK